MCKIHFGALWGEFKTLLGALMAFATLLARRLTLEPSTTPGQVSIARAIRTLPTDQSPLPHLDGAALPEVATASTGISTLQTGDSTAHIPVLLNVQPSDSTSTAALGESGEGSLRVLSIAARRRWSRRRAPRG